MRLQTYESALVWSVCCVLAICMTNVLSAQRIPHRIVFADKGQGTFLPGNSQYDSVLATYSPQAVKRRMSIGKNPLLDSLDRPVSEEYVGLVLSVSDSLIASSSWLNSITVGLTSAEAIQVRTLPGVRLVTPSSSLSFTQSDPSDCTELRYGPSELQNKMIGAVKLHNAGVYGRGVRIGVLDNGFRPKGVSSLQHVEIEDEYDFVFRDKVVSNEEEDRGDQDAHGTFVLSVMAGWEHDSIHGVAPFGTFLLAKSEDMRYERRVEEDLYVEALEWLEKSGVSITNSSIGYRYFDSTDAETPYSRLDGRTTFSARAVNQAVACGVICVTSAGNYGPEYRTLITPADADSAITVGGYSIIEGIAWPKTSCGPTADGRTKPDFSALAMTVRFQRLDGSYRAESGTSFSSPAIAGGIALLRELYPDLPPWSIREALRVTSVFPSNPDTVLGHGAVDLYNAARLLGPGIGPPAVVIVDNVRTILASVFTNSSTSVLLHIRDPITGVAWEIDGQRIEEPWYQFSIPSSMLYRDSMQMRITATKIGSGKSGSFPRDTSWTIIPRNQIVRPCGMRFPGSVTSVEASYLPTTGPLAVDHPLSYGTRQIEVTNAPIDVGNVRLIDVTSGTYLPCSYTSFDLGSLSVNLQFPLYSGAYLLILQTTQKTITLPLIVR